MFTFRRDEVLPVEVYGKLPIAKDYLRIGCSEGAAAAWRDWLDRAYSGTAAGVFPSVAWPARFATGEAWGEALIGTLSPSSDAGGLRKFPITFLVERRKKLARADLADGWPSAGALWRELGALKREAEGRADGQQFLASVRGREFDVAKLTPARSEGIDFGAWKQALDDGGDGLLRIFRRLAELRRGGARAVVRVPLVSNLDATAQTHAWCTLCREIGVLAADELPTVVFPESEPQASVPAFALFAQRTFSPADVVWLAPPTSVGTAGLEDLCDAFPRRAVSAPESAQPLINSLRGAWTAFSARGS